MHERRGALVAAAMVLVVTLALPVVAQAATIYINSGVSGAKLGMKDTTAAKKLGKVVKKYQDTSYDETIWVRCFGKKSNGHYALYLYSNGSHKVTAFIIYASKYKTKKGIHTGSSLKALKKAYGKSLKKSGSYYKLKGKSGKTWFRVTGSKVRKIWIWR